MLWIDFPPVAEFEDRHGIVRPIRGCTIFGRFEFADRMGNIQEILSAADPALAWTEIYRTSGKLRHEIDRALECWGVNVNHLTAEQIEGLLFRSANGGQGSLVRLATANNSAAGADTKQGTLEESIAAIATHCSSLMEAMDLAREVPAAMLAEILKAKASYANPQAESESSKKHYVKQNLRQILAGFKNE